VLEQRNSLLRQLRDRGGAADQLAFWDDRLVRAGAEIIACRQQVVLDLEAYAQPIHRDLSGGQERLRLRYVPSFDPNSTAHTDQDLLPGLELPPPISIPQEPPAVRERFSRELRAMRQQEIQRGMTLIGPHRDDLRFLNGQIDLQVYGSRGQQRTAVLATKLAEVNLMHQKTDEQPILLLDEVMSELDPARRRYLCDQLCQVEQSLITTTDLDALTSSILAQAAVFRVSQGHLEQIEPDS
jgi:DNA replication and repair protein RecF